MQIKLGAAMLLSASLLLGLGTSVSANTTTDLGGNLVLPPTVTSPTDGEKVKTDFIKLTGTTAAKFKIQLTVDGKPYRFQGKKYLTADKNGNFQAYFPLHGALNNNYVLDVYAVNPDSGKMSTATEVTVTLNADTSLTSHHGQVGYCDEAGNFVQAPQSKKIFFYRFSLAKLKMLQAVETGGGSPMIYADTAKVKANGKFNVTLHHAVDTYIGLVGSTTQNDDEGNTEGVVYVDMENQTGKDLGLICL